jgi:excinuclease UvrABC nuclease subunit
MPWNGTNGFYFNRANVELAAPALSGVYALFNKGVWVYIGEARNIRARLLDHLTNCHNADVVAANPQYFAFELAPEASRIARQNQLILELCPTCNKRLG